MLTRLIDLALDNRLLVVTLVPLGRPAKPQATATDHDPDRAPEPAAHEDRPER